MHYTRRSFVPMIRCGGGRLQTRRRSARDVAAGPNDGIGLGFIGMGIRGSYHLRTLKPVSGSGR